MLQGVWNPVQVKQLTETLTADWDNVACREWTDEETDMRRLAEEPAMANCDSKIRAWTALENDTLVNYMAGKLDLPHPPNFIKEIMIAEHRAMLEDFHEKYLNVTLTAKLPPSVRLPKQVPHADLFKELFQANTCRRFGTAMMRVLQEDVKRLDYDGTHTLHLVFYSRHAADRWVLKTLRFQKAVITMQDTARKPGEAREGTYNAAQLGLQYAVRVYGAQTIGLVTLVRAFKRIAGACLLDVEYARARKTEIYDNRYHTVRFAQPGCPTELVDVTRVLLDDMQLTIHHFQNQLRRPCGRCYSPRHGRKKCTVSEARLEEARSRYSRRFDGSVETAQSGPRSDYYVDSAAKLVELLTSMQEDAVMQEPKSLLRHPNGGAQVTLMSAGVEPATTAEPVHTEALHKTSANGIAAPKADVEVDAAGYTVHRSKSAKRAAKKDKTVTRSVPPETESAQTREQETMRRVPRAAQDKGKDRLAAHTTPVVDQTKAGRTTADKDVTAVKRKGKPTKS
ncbi:hypothetical protein PR002_g30538, partial [Phytophthora rubi]